MAKKGQKFKKYSPELKEEILGKYWSGESAHCLIIGMWFMLIKNQKKLKSI